ncbi:MAG: hypothetical protein J6Y53_00620 [Alphaproteobacteria bacterium]|nr:hypothetical protein [Alphaproteobacteria bacterium]
MRIAKDYKTEYAKQIIEWFRDAPLFVDDMKEVFNKKTEKFDVVSNKVAAPCPTVVRFAENIGVTIDRVFAWRDSIKEFRDAYEQAMRFQEEWLMNAAGLGFYNSSMSITALKANHGWAEKNDRQPLKDELKQVLVEFVRGKEKKFEKDHSEDSGNIFIFDDGEMPD